MKRQDRSLKSDMRAIKMYLDDLDDICEILSKIDTPEITVNGNYVMDSVAEIEEKFSKNLDSVEFLVSSEGNRISLTLGKRHSSLYFSGDNSVVKGLIRDIEEILKHNQRTILSSRLASGIIAIFLSALAILATALVVGNLPLSKDLRDAITTPLLLLILWPCLWPMLPYVLGEGRSKLRPIRRRDETSFWKRKRDDIIMLVIGLIAGYVLNELIQLV